MASSTRPTSARTRTRKKPVPKAGQGLEKNPAPILSAEERHRWIAEAAFFRAERRGFAGGDPLEDWLEAERELDRMRGVRQGGD